MNGKQSKKLRRAARLATDFGKAAPAVAYQVRDNGTKKVFDKKLGHDVVVKKRSTSRLALSTRGVMQSMKHGFKVEKQK